MTVRRISQMLSDVVEETALIRLADDDRFDFEVGLAPIAHVDPSGGGVVYEMSAWALMRLECPETDSKSVLSVSWPLQYLNPDEVRIVISNAITEMTFARIAAAFHLDPELESETITEEEDSSESWWSDSDDDW